MRIVTTFYFEDGNYSRPILYNNQYHESIFVFNGEAMLSFSYCKLYWGQYYKFREIAQLYFTLIMSIWTDYSEVNITSIKATTLVTSRNFVTLPGVGPI